MARVIWAHTVLEPVDAGVGENIVLFEESKREKKIKLFIDEKVPQGTTEEGL